MPIFARSKHRKNARTRLATAAAAVIGGLILSTVAVVTTTQSADAALQQPLAGNHGFTVVTEGDATFSSTAETEGSWAIGGNLVQLGSTYAIANTALQPTSALPSVGGIQTRLLVNGTASIVAGDNQERLNVGTGDGYGTVQIGSSAIPYSVAADGRIQDASLAYIKTDSPPAALDAFGYTPGAFASVFGGSTFSTYRALSSTLVGLANTGTATPVITTDASSFGIALVANKINVWNVTPTQFSDLNGVKPNLAFVGGVSPSASTSLIINLPSTTTSFNNPSFTGDTTAIAQFVLWNVANTTSFELTGSQIFSGALLVPWADFVFNKGTPMEGQVAAKTAHILGSAEIHHVAFLPTLDTNPCFANPTWSYTWNAATGVATITAAGGTAGQSLCTPLYVRATSWNYDTPVKNTNPSWPQTFSGKSDYTINTIGTHTVTAPGVACGQDDIYATFSSAGFQALKINSVLTAPGKPREPSFLHDAITSGTGGSTWHTDAPSLCKTNIEITKAAVASGTGNVVTSLDPSSSFDYTIVVRNSGPNHATGVKVTDSIPSNLTITGNASGTGWTCFTNNQNVACDYATALSAGTTAGVIRVPVKLKDGILANSVLNAAKACATNVATCVWSEAVVTIVRPGISLDKTASVTETEKGGSFRYDLVVKNTGTATANGVTVTDTLDENLKVSGRIIKPVGWTCTAGTDWGATIDCAPTSGSVAAGASFTITVPVTVTGDVKVTDIPNTATVCATNTAVPCDDGYVKVVVVRPKIDLEKTASVESTEAGSSYEYTLVASNPGTGAATNPVVTDTLPKDLTLNGTPTYPTGWTYTPSTEPDGRQTVTFEFAGTLAAAASASFVIPVTVAAKPTATTLENTGSACTDNTAPKCDTDTVITPIKSITLLVDAVCTNDVPYLHYSITTTNVDLTVNPQVTIEWSPKTGPVEAWATTHLASAPVLDGYLLWPGAAVDATGKATAWPGWSQVNGVWVYDPTAPGANLRDQPRITASINPSTSVTVSYPEQSTGCADPAGDLTLVKTESSSTVTAGDEITYGLTVTNIGGTPIDGVSITDTVPDSLTVTDVDFNGAVWSDCEWSGGAGDDVTCDLDGALASGASASVTIVATVADDVAGTVDNSACALTEPAGQDRDSTNNCSQVSADVPGLAIVKDTAADYLAIGDAFSYSITVTNPGNAPAEDVVVTDTLRPELALTALPTATGWTCAGPLGAAGAAFTCTKSDPLLVTDTAIITVPVKVIDGLVVAKTITVPNTAKVCASNVTVVSTKAVNGCPTSTVSVQVVPDLDVLAPAGLEILKTASVTRTAPGGSYSYTLLVGNTDFGDTLDVVVSDTLDPRLRLAKVPSGTDFTCVVTDNGTNGFGATFECDLLVPLVNGSPKSVLVNVLVDAGADPDVSTTIPNTAVVCASNFLGCLQSSVSVTLSSSQLDTLPFTGVEAVGVGAIALGALGLGLGLVLLGLTRRSRKQPR